MIQWGKYSLRMYKFQKYCYDKLLKEADSKGGTVEYICLTELYLTELPEFFKDLTVESYFDVERNKLTSCKNFPKVKTALYAGDNQIKDLDGLQNLPSESVYLQHNELSSLEPLSQFNQFMGTLYATHNKLTSMKGLENKNIDTVRIYNNEISSWQYAPPSRSLSIAFNKLTTWEGMPSGLIYLNVRDNWDIKNMDEFKRVIGTLYLTSSTLNQETIRQELRSKSIYPPTTISVHGIRR